MRRSPVVLLALSLLALSALPACGGPSGQSPVNLAGTWAGTLTAPTFAVDERVPDHVPITVTLAQDGFSVTGTWTSTVPGWNGTLSGLADTAAFDGRLSIPSAVFLDPDLEGHCTGSVLVKGSATSRSIHWTSYGEQFTCNGGGPNENQIPSGDVFEVSLRR
jgi:hypothetical protein